MNLCRVGGGEMRSATPSFRVALLLAILLGPAVVAGSKDASCITRPSFMPEEHFAAFLQADSNGDLRVSKEEIALPSHLIMSDGDEDLMRFVHSMLELSDEDKNGELSMTEFRRLLDMKLEDVPAERHSDIKGIGLNDDIPYPNHPVFLQLAERMMVNASAMGDAEARESKDGGFLSRPRNFFAAIWRFMRTPVCYATACGKGILDRLYIGFGYGFAWDAPSVSFNIKVRVNPVNVVCKGCDLRLLRKCLSLGKSAQELQNSVDPCGAFDKDLLKAKAEAEAEPESEGVGDMDRKCHKVCHKDHCKGTATNSIPFGKQWETKPSHVTDNSCCRGGNEQCHVCCEPLETATKEGDGDASMLEMATTASVSITDEMHQRNLDKLDAALRSVGYDPALDDLHDHLDPSHVSDHQTKSLYHLSRTRLHQLISEPSDDDLKHHQKTMESFLEQHSELLQELHNEGSKQANDTQPSSETISPVVIKVAQKRSMDVNQFFSRCLVDKPCSACNIGFTISAGADMPFAIPTAKFTFNFGPMTWLKNGNAALHRCITMCPACATNRIPLLGKLAAPMLKFAFYDIPRQKDLVTAALATSAGPCFMLPFKALPMLLDVHNTHKDASVKPSNGLSITFGVNPAPSVGCGISCAPSIKCLKSGFNSIKETFWKEGAESDIVIKGNLQRHKDSHNQHNPCSKVNVEPTAAEMKTEKLSVERIHDRIQPLKGIEDSATALSEGDQAKQMENDTSCDTESLASIPECAPCKTIVGFGFSQFPVPWAKFGNGFMVGPVAKCASCGFKLLARQVSQAGRRAWMKGFGDAALAAKRAKADFLAWMAKKKEEFKTGLAVLSSESTAAQLDTPCDRNSMAMCILVAQSSACRDLMKEGVSGNQGGRGRLQVFQAGAVLNSLGFLEASRTCRSTGSNRPYVPKSANGAKKKSGGDPCGWPKEGEVDYSVCNQWEKPSLTNLKGLILDNGDIVAPRYLCEAVKRKQEEVQFKFCSGEENADCTNFIKSQCMRMLNCDAKISQLSSDNVKDNHDDDSDDDAAFLQTANGKAKPHTVFDRSKADPRTTASSHHIDRNTGLSHHEIMETIRTFGEWLQIHDVEKGAQLFMNKVDEPPHQGGTSEFLQVDKKEVHDDPPVIQGGKCNVDLSSSIVEKEEKEFRQLDAERNANIGHNTYSCPDDFGDLADSAPFFAGRTSVSLPKDFPIPGPDHSGLNVFDVKIPLYNTFVARHGCNIGRRPSLRESFTDKGENDVSKELEQFADPIRESEWFVDKEVDAYCPTCRRDRPCVPVGSKLYNNLTKSEKDVNCAFYRKNGEDFKGWESNFGLTTSTLVKAKPSGGEETIKMIDPSSSSTATDTPVKDSREFYERCMGITFADAEKRSVKQISLSESPKQSNCQSAMEEKLRSLLNSDQVNGQGQTCNFNHATKDRVNKCSDKTDCSGCTMSINAKGLDCYWCGTGDGKGKGKCTSARLTNGFCGMSAIKMQTPIECADSRMPDAKFPTCSSVSVAFTKANDAKQLANAGRPQSQQQPLTPDSEVCSKCVQLADKSGSPCVFCSTGPVYGCMSRLSAQYQCASSLKNSFACTAETRKVNDCKEVDLTMDLADDRKKVPFKQLTALEHSSMCRTCTGYRDTKGRQCSFCPSNGKCRWTGSKFATLKDATYESCAATASSKPKQCGFDFMHATKQSREAQVVVDKNKANHLKDIEASKAADDAKAQDKLKQARAYVKEHGVKADQDDFKESLKEQEQPKKKKKKRLSLMH